MYPNMILYRYIQVTLKVMFTVKKVELSYYNITVSFVMVGQLSYIVVLEHPR